MSETARNETARNETTTEATRTFVETGEATAILPLASGRRPGTVIGTPASR